MKKLFALLLAASLPLGLASCGSAPPEPEEPTTLTTEQKREDLEQFCEMVLSTHPAPFFHQSKEEYEARKAELIEKLPGLTDVGFELEMMRFAASFGDEHLSIPPASGKGFACLPMIFSYFDDGCYITAADKSASQWLGYRLTKIGGKTMEEVEALFSPYISHQAIEWVHVMYSQLLNNAALLRYMGTTESISRVMLTLTGPNGKERQLRLDTKPKSEWAYSETLEGGYEPTRQKESNYSIESWEGGVIYLQYNSCMEQEDYSTQQLGADMKALLWSRPGEWRKVVVDVRHNVGGNSNLIRPTYQSIFEYMQSFPLRPYTIIGQQTFSSGVTSSVDMKINLHSTLVGGPTGCVVNLYGDIKFFTLEHSGMIGEVATKCTDYYHEGLGEAGNLKPDVAVPNLFDDYIAGRDACVDYILNSN